MAPGLKHFLLFGRSKIGVSDKKSAQKRGGGGERRGERNKLCAKILAVRKSARPNFRISKKCLESAQESLRTRLLRRLGRFSTVYMLNLYSRFTLQIRG